MSQKPDNLPQISRQEFLRKLKSKPFENVSLLNSVESILKKNGGLFRLPRRGSPVILFVSGGLDSIVCWDILMGKFGLKVYPLCLKRGLKRNKIERRSVKFFCNFYQKKYPKLYHEPFYLEAPLSKLNFDSEKASKIMHPQAILNNFVSKPKITANLTMGSASIYPLMGKYYSQYLKYTQNINIHTIFCAFLASDGGIPEETFTSLRTGTLYLRTTTTDNRWQYSSLCLEKELGFYLYKKDLIKWGVQHHIPLEKTWSCYQHYRLPCGLCIACYVRKKAFKEAGVSDKTVYLPLSVYDLPIYKLLKSFRIKLLQIFKSINEKSLR